MIDNLYLVMFTLVLARIATFIAFFPLFSGRQLPNLVKVGLAASLAIFWSAEASSQLSWTVESVVGLGMLEASLLIVREVFIGFVLAVALGCFLWPARVAGAYIGQELGLSLASLNDPGSQDSSTLVTRIFDNFAILVFFASNLHHFVIITLHVSFTYVLSRTASLEFPVESIVTILNRSTERGLLIAGPVLVLLMLVTLVLLFLNRAAPALNLFSVGISIRASLGIGCVLLFCPVIMLATQVYFDRIRSDVEAFLGQLIG